MSCCKKCCIPPYYFLLANINIRGSFVAVLQELDANSNVAATVTIQGQLAGLATNANISLIGTATSASHSGNDNVGAVSFFINGAPSTALVGISYTNFTTSAVDSYVSQNNITVPGTSTLTGNSVAFTRVNSTGNTTVNYNYTFTITIN